MESQNKTKKLYLVTIVVFLVIVVLGQVVNLWRGDDYKFLLLLFVLINIALRLDEIYLELKASKAAPATSDMYVLDTRMQSIIEALDRLNRNIERLTPTTPEEPEKDTRRP